MHEGGIKVLCEEKVGNMIHALELHSDSRAKQWLNKTSKQWHEVFDIFASIISGNEFL